MRAGRSVAGVVVLMMLVGGACSGGGSSAPVVATAVTTGESSGVVDDSSPALPASSCRDPRPSVIVWLELDVTAAQRRAIEDELTGTSGVDHVVYVDQVAAYAEFGEMFSSNPEMVASVDPADLPASLRVVLDAPVPLTVVDELAEMPGVRQTSIDPCEPQVVMPRRSS
jgi:hypothetical protein